MNLNTGKILRWGCAAFIIYLLACCLFPPLLRTKPNSSSALVPDETSYFNSISESGLTGISLGTDQSERVLCIDDNSDALFWRLRVIESAQNELILSTFNFCDDNSGLDIMAALKGAADRGVQIKILVDGLYGFLALENSNHFQSLISLPAVEAKLYNPVKLSCAWTGNYRLHDKYLIADNSVYILGGRNIGDLFLGDYDENANIDRDVLVYEAFPGQGLQHSSESNLTIADTSDSAAAEIHSVSAAADAPSSLTQLREYFDAIWNLTSNKTLSNKQSSRQTEKGILALDSHYESMRSIFPEAFTEPDWTASTLPANKILLCTNPIEPENKVPTLWNSLCSFMAASENVIIQTPYVMLDKQMYSDLSAVAAKGTQVTLMTNAVETGANPWGCSDYQNQKNNILGTGVNICEYPGTQSVHTKTLLLDDNISVIGSYNMDMRSTYLDTEMMLIIDCPALNQMLKENTAGMAAISRLVHSDGTVEYGEYYVEPEYGIFKKGLYTVIRVVCPFIRHLL